MVARNVLLLIILRKRRIYSNIKLVVPQMKKKYYFSLRKFPQLNSYPIASSSEISKLSLKL